MIGRIEKFDPFVAGHLHLTQDHSGSTRTVSTRLTRTILDVLDKAALDCEELADERDDTDDDEEDAAGSSSSGSTVTESVLTEIPPQKSRTVRRTV